MEKYWAVNFTRFKAPQQITDDNWLLWSHRISQLHFSPLELFDWEHPTVCLTPIPHWNPWVAVSQEFRPQQKPIRALLRKGTPRVLGSPGSRSLLFPQWDYMGVSINAVTPKMIVFNGKSYLNGWFGGTTIYGNPYVCRCNRMETCASKKKEKSSRSCSILGHKQYPASWFQVRVVSVWNVLYSSRTGGEDTIR